MKMILRTAKSMSTWSEDMVTKKSVSMRFSTKSSYTVGCRGEKSKNSKRYWESYMSWTVKNPIPQLTFQAFK